MGPVPAWGLFRLLRAVQDRSGPVRLDVTLNHAGNPARVSIGLLQGRPRCVASDWPAFSLATYLAQARVLPEVTIQKYLAAARASHTPLCLVLVSERALAPEDLARHLVAHARAAIAALLPTPLAGWSLGLGDFCANGCPAAGFDVVPLLMSTAARHPDVETMRAIVSRFLGKGDCRLAPGYEAFLSAARTQFHDARVLFLLRQGRHREMAQAISADERDLRVLFALIVAGALEHGPARTSAILPEDPSEDPLSRELRHTALDFRSRNHYEVLDVAVDARVSQVEEAGRRLRRRFARARYEGSVTPRALQYLDEVIARIDEAVRTLCDMDLRSAYNRTLGSGIGADVQARLAAIFEARASWQAGQVALKAGNHKEALACFERAMQEDPEEPLYPLAVARVLVSRASDVAAGARARSLVEGVLARWPEYPEAHVVMAHILRGEGHKDEALEHVRAVLRSDPEHAEARHLRELLRAKSKPLPVNFRKKPESLLTRLKNRLKGGQT